MNEMMVKGWNDTVGPDDIVYCLGDFAMSWNNAQAYSARLVGKKILVPGNHDYCHSYHKKSRKLESRQSWIKEYEKLGWEVLPEQTTLEIPGVATVNMCHHPYYIVNGDENDDKYAKWRPHDDGRWLICGHVHENWKQVGKMINVGVDQWGFKPVAITEIEKIILNDSKD
jgi:calcineurin-like phosphoesterase family protein